MLPVINLTANRNFRIRNFEEDKIATLSANKGLHYIGERKASYLFRGNYYLINPQGDFIESFEIAIVIEQNYPNTFPVVFLLDDKIEKNADNHINPDCSICFDHTYVTNALAARGLRLFDFVNYYPNKYFSWILVKQYGQTHNLQEWAHDHKGKIQLYESLLETTEKDTLRLFLETYCRTKALNRNDKCYCGNGKKLKKCHFEAARFLKSTPLKNIQNDVNLFCDLCGS